MQSAITISLVPQARGGPFVFWDDLAEACSKAAELGFNAVEIFAPDPAALDVDRVRPLLDRHKLQVAAVGTGAGWVLQKLTLTDADPAVRSKAREFIRGMIDAGARLGAPAIIGSMQGRWGESVTRKSAIAYLVEALNDLGQQALGHGVPLFYEPLNRYETNLITTQLEGYQLLGSMPTRNVKLLADLFHMNIEESDLSSAIRGAGGAIGHVHLADSNRRPAGNGHMDFAAIAMALREIGYAGYISAECLPWPDSDSAARDTMTAFGKYFRAQ